MIGSKIEPSQSAHLPSIARCLRTTQQTDKAQAQPKTIGVPALPGGAFIIEEEYTPRYLQMAHNGGVCPR